MSALPHYPRTLHLPGSGTGVSKHQGDVSSLVGQPIVVEEKLDGAHVGLFFDDDACLQLFSRNTLLESPLSSLWRPLRQLCELHLDALYDVLCHRYVLYGEWMLHTHSIVYDALPAHFIEDDVFDREANAFLSTSRRQQVLAHLTEPFSHKAPVLFDGTFTQVDALLDLVGPSAFQTPDASCNDDGVEQSRLMEGLYIKHEVGDVVRGRFKWVRPSFVRHVQGAAHWSTRSTPLLNLLR